MRSVHKDTPQFFCFTNFQIFTVDFFASGWYYIFVIEHLF